MSTSVVEATGEPSESEKKKIEMNLAWMVEDVRIAYFFGGNKGNILAIFT